MRIHREENGRLSEARAAVEAECPLFGVNKKREIVRLLCEISRREGISPREVLAESGRRNFHALKDALVRRRFPRASESGTPPEPHLPALEFPAGSRCTRADGSFRPREIIVERSVKGSPLAERFAAAFPEARLSETGSLKEHIAARGPSTIADYNARCDTVFIVEEKSDFFKRCPCTAGAVSCGYHIFNLAFGCMYDCTYCYLQGYANTPGIIFPAELGGFFRRFDEYACSPGARAWHGGSRLRVGTGEFSDSLMLDDLTGYSLPIIEFFRDRDDAIFEFKTKSANVGNLLGASHGGKIVAGWSLNPQSVIDGNEHGTASLEERLEAASRCAAAGYRISFHFDPVIFFEGWEKEYGRIVEALFDAVPPRGIAWISVGTLRFAPALKRVIEVRFPENTILDGELLPGFDGKLRYPRALRLEIYRGMLSMLRRRGGDVPLYLCMEDARMWRELGMKNPFG